jgi:hypothetical protein
MKISTYMQTLLRPKNLDPWIIIDLNLDPIVDILPVNPGSESRDLINDLL